MLAIVNNVAMNTEVHGSFWIRSRIVGSHGSSIFLFLRNLHAILYSGCTNLYSHQRCRRVAFPPHPSQHLLSVFFLIIAILTNERWYLIVVLICLAWWLAMLNIFSYEVQHCLNYWSFVVSIGIMKYESFDIALLFKECIDYSGSLVFLCELLDQVVIICKKGVVQLLHHVWLFVTPWTAPYLDFDRGCIEFKLFVSFNSFFGWCFRSSKVYSTCHLQVEIVLLLYNLLCCCFSH